MKITNIAVHHTAGDFDTLQSINAWHKKQWPELPSEMRPDLWVGYNIVIWKNGDWTQCRFLGEETAAQKKHNKDTVSICLAGNFSKSLPTKEQENTLRALTINIIEQAGSLFAVKKGTTFLIPKKNIFPHRGLQLTTECYGKLLPDDWARKIVYSKEKTEVPFIPIQNKNGEKMDIIKQLIVLFQQLLAQIAQEKRQGCTGDTCS